MKSWLCSVARLTVVPAKNTGSNTPVGVKTPVRPTATSMSRSVVSFFTPPAGTSCTPPPSAGTFADASECLALREKLSTLQQRRQSGTRTCRARCRSRILLDYRLYVARAAISETPVKQETRKRFNASACVVTVTLDDLNVKNKISSVRCAVIFGSFCRSDPAAALRGFLNDFSSKKLLPLAIAAKSFRPTYIPRHAPPKTAAAL